MTKDAISDYSTTAGSNTDVGGVNVDEGCPPSSLNNGIREVMSHLADLNAGNSSLGTLKVDNLQLDANAITSTDTNGNITITPHGTGSVVIDGLTHPQADGSSGQLLKTNGSGVLSFVTGYAHPNHSGEVVSTGDGATVIADNIVDEANLKVSNTPTNGYFLSAQSGNTGGLTWAEAASSPFTPVAVTGTTPSLNVGSYNFFDNGTMAGNTTLSFASVPTEANWRYSVIADGAGFGLANSSYVQQYVASAQISTGSGMFFKSDGTKMYLLDDADSYIHQYTLSTAWDLSTTSYDSVSYLTTTGTPSETGPQGIFFKPDGTKMYLTGTNADKVWQYALSTAWYLSTISYDNKVFDVSSQETNPKGVFFKTDGTIMYIIGTTGDAVFQYTLSTAWDVSTASYASKTFSVASQITVPQDIHFKSDGTKMYITGWTGAYVYQYTLSTAWDVSTASYDSISASMGGNPYALYIKSDGKKLYQFNGGNTVKEYNILTPYTLTLPSSAVLNSSISLTVGNKKTIDFYTLDGGTTVYVIDQASQ